jgi:hypothetical protein
MRLLWVVVLLAMPVAVLAQQGPVLRENKATDETVVPMPPPDATVTATPLPPPDQSPPPGDPTGGKQEGANQQGADQEMVPNPLDDTNGAPASAPARQAQQQGQPWRGGWVRMGTATLQALDKVNARAETLVVKVGDAGHFGSLNIAVRGCFVRPSDQPADATAFLVIRDQRPDAPSFVGWMDRGAPSMSMLAHPIYDVRIEGCSP